MELKLDNGDLDKAIQAYLTKMGINITGKQIDLKFSVGRAPNNIVTVAVNINEVASTEAVDFGGTILSDDKLEIDEFVTNDLADPVTQEELPQETEEADDVTVPETGNMFDDDDDEDED